MTPRAECRLPSIDSLSLDLPQNWAKQAPAQLPWPGSQAILPLLSQAPLTPGPVPPVWPRNTYYLPLPTSRRLLASPPAVAEPAPAVLRRRKKRQCPECHLYFSNLATHKQTHLNPNLRPHVCKICHRGFARPNDLFRHFKCHWKEVGADNGQFRCPFKSAAHADQCCHTLGIFSRCDTYKNHLKAIHFQFPGGTKKSQRNNVPGCCRLCQQAFQSVDEWIASHVETGDCSYIHG